MLKTELLEKKNLSESTLNKQFVKKQESVSTWRGLCFHKFSRFWRKKKYLFIFELASAIPSF